METESGKKAMHDETLLIRRILNGDAKSFRPLAARYAERVLRLVARLIPSPEEAEEATQDTLLEAYQSLARFDARQATFQTWLLRIAYHTALKHYRRHRRSVPFLEVGQHWLEAIADDDIDTMLDDTTTDRVVLIERAIDTLKPDDQMLLNLYYFDNRPIRELSCIMEHDEGYLRSRLQWIRKKLAITIKTLESNEQQ